MSFIVELLRGTKYEDDTDYITNCFDKSAKLTFRNANEPQFVKFGRANDTNSALGIRAGQLKLLGYVDLIFLRTFSVDAAP